MCPSLRCHPQLSRATRSRTQGKDKADTEAALAEFVSFKQSFDDPGPVSESQREVPSFRQS